MPEKLFTIHFLPIEGYPPIQNLLDYFSLKNDQIRMFCYTTKGNLNPPTYKNNKIKIYRYGKVSENKFKLWVSYLLFNTTVIFSLLIKRPKNVMYYESISSFPAYFYKTFINKKANIYIHYHEYVTKHEYENGSTINRYFHQLEEKIFSEVKWISHTNKTRLNKFLNDNSIIFDKDKHYLFPNYPSKKWAIQNTPWNGTETLKFVFVGYAVDPKGAFIVELIDWLATQKIKSSIDIYCLKQNSLPENFIGEKGNTTVNIHHSVSYYQLPNILKNYHIGLILYRGLTPNYIYNAPNKLFEYLACGLDVWFPKEMEGCYPYINKNKYPKIIKIDFN